MTTENIHNIIGGHWENEVKFLMYFRKFLLLRSFFGLKRCISLPILQWFPFKVAFDPSCKQFHIEGF